MNLDIRDAHEEPGLSAVRALFLEYAASLGVDLEFQQFDEEPRSELRVADVCAQSGMRAGPHCQSRREKLVAPSGLGAPPCSFCRLLHFAASGAFRVHADCEPVAAIRPASWFVLPPAMEGYYRRRHADYRPPPPFRPDCRAALDAAGGSSLSFVYPKEGAQVYVPVEMNDLLGRVVFEAAHRDPQTHIDDKYYGETLRRCFTVLGKARAGRGE